jgi:hypothetical protein
MIFGYRSCEDREENLKVRNQRDEQADMKTAIDLLFAFGNKLESLHPNVKPAIQILIRHS